MHVDTMIVKLLGFVDSFWHDMRLIPLVRVNTRDWALQRLNYVAVDDKQSSIVKQRSQGL